MLQDARSIYKYKLHNYIFVTYVSVKGSLYRIHKEYLPLINNTKIQWIAWAKELNTFQRYIDSK